MDRPVTTLFMLMSLDGKISTGAGDGLDFDRDLPRVPGVAEGLNQYYELEQLTDLWSLNTGRVMAKVVVITSNEAHPAFAVGEDNLSVMLRERASLAEALRRLRSEHGCERLTVQSGGTLNAALVREGLVDFVDVVVAPLVVGGRDTPTLVDGPSLTSVEKLSRLCPLELLGCEALQDSCVRLRYRVAQPSQDYA